ncbi:MAG TPA: hypothetical protein VN767_20530 [Streptosporangiaceae bacterium]|nr:hypothetical protein [Streptosporangiaceae bacterium]
MSERDARYVGNEPSGSGYPSSTGEFRAAPDISASTAEFKRFATGQVNGTSPATDSGSWPEQPWDGGGASSGGGGSNRMVLIAVGALVLVIVVLAIILFA